MWINPTFACGSLLGLSVLGYGDRFSRLWFVLRLLLGLLSYCLGFSAGTLLGMLLEERIAIGFATIRVISPNQSQQVAEAIRNAGRRQIG